MLLKNDINNIKKIVKTDNLLTKPEELYCYAEDSTNFDDDLINPDAVVFVENIEQVQKLLCYANKMGIPIISRGAGTNMVGACTCPKGGIVLNFSRMNKILNFNSIDMTMTVQPGVVIDDIKKLAETEGLFYPPDPSNYKVSTIGGSIAQSSGGAMGFKYGTTKDYILNLKVVLADGTLLCVGSNTVKNAVGYHLNQLFVGSEGTLAIVVEAVLKLIPKPQAQQTVLAYFDTLLSACNGVTSILKNKIFPSAIDFMDKNSIVTVERFYPSGLMTNKEAVLLINVDGFESSMEYQVSTVIKSLECAGATNIKIARTQSEIDAIWTARRSSFAATAKLAPDVLSDDVIVPRSNISKMVIGTKKICQEYNLPVCIVGHLGDGNIHPQIALNLNNNDEKNRYFSARKKIYDLVLSLGGTISAEHGIGIEKIDYIKACLDDRALHCMKNLKKILDPNGILNPCKIFE